MKQVPLLHRCIKTISLAVVFIGCLCGTSLAQNTFRGILLNRADSFVIPFAAVHLRETGKDILTDTAGAFELNIPVAFQKATLDIAAIGCKVTVIYRRPFNTVERIYIDVNPNELNGVAIRGLSAQEVVKEAVQSIPRNYADSSYAAYGMYRQYQRVNGRFTNLIEMQPVTMFRLSKTRKEIISKEAFAVKEFRRTEYDSNPSNVYEDNPADLLLENPVYHLMRNSLEPGKLDEYDFNFDTTVKTHDYVIKYRCRKFSSEVHGWEDRDYWYAHFHNESYEEGRMVIDRESFAIKKYDRKATRYPDYSYPRFPPMNIVGGIHKYFIEFVDADLHAEYAQKGGKWYLSRLCHAYTDDFFDYDIDVKTFTVTNAAEWKADSVSRYVGKDIYNKFRYRPGYGDNEYPYDKEFWNKVDFPFYFYDKAAVYGDLEKAGPLEPQFASEGLIGISTR